MHRPSKPVPHPFRIGIQCLVLAFQDDFQHHCPRGRGYVWRGRPGSVLGAVHVTVSPFRDFVERTEPERS